MKIDLNGKWLFKSSDSDEFMEAVVPGNNFLDLMRLGKIPDPYFKTNEKKVQWVGDKNWVYCKTFDLTDNFLANDKIFLVCKQLDTLCEIDINGIKYYSSNAFYSHSFEIKQSLRVGENKLIITFSSPVAFSKTAYKLCKTPVNNNGLTGIVHLRKPQCHFGWDWGPTLPLSGITDDIYLESRNYGRIKSFNITQTHNHDGSVTLSMLSEIDNYNGYDFSVMYSVLCPDGVELSASAVDVGNLFKAEIVIEKPQLWWIRELSDSSEQPLYEIISSLSYENEIIDGNIKKIGLRTIKLLRNKDEYGQNFCFELNGVEIFAKGANVIPFDSLNNRISSEKLDAILNAAVFSNMNMLRVWGGGYYGTDDFYDKCDKLGILVWQDFMFACQAYPFFIPNFIENVNNEIKEIVTRLRHHPSLAVWCGNNEIEAMTFSWMHLRKYVEWSEKYFYHLLPEILRDLDDRDYITGSPSGLDFMYGVDNDNVGDSHLWAVWHGLQPIKYYRKRYPRFCSEFGFESLPNINTIKSFSEEGDLVLNSEVMRSHQKCNNGNNKMKYYIGSRFRLPKNFSDYIYLSQICQSECVRDASEHWRRNKGRCNGSLFWQLNDCWPTCSWSSIDNYCNYKALQYTAKRFFKPFTVSIEESDGGFLIYYLNDTLYEYNAHLNFKVCNYDGKVLLEKNEDFTAEKNKCAKIIGVGMAAIRNQNKHLRVYAVATLTVDGEEISKSILHLSKEKNAKFPAAIIHKEVSVIDGNLLQITLTSNVYAPFVMVSNSTCDNHFSDNFFHLLPNEPKTITQKIDSVEEFSVDEKAITVFTVADLGEKQNFFFTAITRLFIIMNPVNFFGKIFMKRIPADIKSRWISDYGLIDDDEEE